MKTNNNETKPSALHEIPKEIEKVLLLNKELLNKWNSLTPLARNEWICWVTIVKNKKQEKSILFVYKKIYLKEKRDLVVGLVVLIAEKVRKNGLN